MTGSRECQKYRSQAEILSVQVKKRVSRNQAKAILGERNPHFRKLSFAEAAKRNGVSSSVAEESREGLTIARVERAIKGNQRTEVVSMSPGSGELFTRTVNLGGATSSRSENEEGTSETDVNIREEVRGMFEEETRKHSREENDSNEELERYEAELKRARVCRENREREGDKRGRSGTPTRERKGRNRSRSPRNKRAHSNVTDQRREKVNIKHS